MGKEAAEDLHALDRAARLHAQCDGGQVDDDAFDERLALPTIGLEAAANLDFSDGLAHPLTCRIALPQETGFRRRPGRTYNPNVPPRLSRRSRRRRWAGAATGQTNREFRLGPGREIAWLPACNFVCKRNLVVRIGTQVRMSLKVSKRRCHLSSTRKERSENFRRDLFEREFMALPIQRVDDFVEAHKITDEGQILAVPGLIRVCEGTGHDVADFSDVARVDATHSRGSIGRAQPIVPSSCWCGASAPTRFW